MGERLERAAEKLGLTPDRAWEVLWEARKVLINVRGGRERPRVDGKVLTDWNGMMLHALAHLYWATRDPQVLEPARALWRLVEERMDGDRISHACYGNAECVEGMLPDYAYPAAALTALYTVTGESEALETARSLVKDMIDLLWSPGGGYFRLSPPGPHNPDTPADVEDTAYPGAYGTAVHALLLVHRATGWMRAREAALRALRRVAARLEQDPVAHASLALATLNTAPLAVEVFAQGAGEGFRGEVLERVYNPYLVLHISPRPEDLRRLVEYAASMPPVEGGRPTFYICHGGVCCEPLKDKWSALDVVARLSKKLG